MVLHFEGYFCSWDESEVGVNKFGEYFHVFLFMMVHIICSTQQNEPKPWKISAWMASKIAPKACLYATKHDTDAFSVLEPIVEKRHVRPRVLCHQCLSVPGHLIFISLILLSAIKDSQVSTQLTVSRSSLVIARLDRLTADASSPPLV